MWKMYFATDCTPCLLWNGSEQKLHNLKTDIIMIIVMSDIQLYCKFCLSYIVWMCCSVVGRVVPDDVKDCNAVIFRVSSSLPLLGIDPQIIHPVT
jgi:hypothetical protein